MKKTKYWGRYKEYLTADEIRSLNSRTVNLRGCSLWLGRSVNGRPIMYSHKLKRDVYVRTYIAKAILTNCNEKVTKCVTSCGRKDCVIPAHIIINPRIDLTSATTLYRLINEDKYCLRYLSKEYNISLYQLRKLKIKPEKTNDSGVSDSI